MLDLDGMGDGGWGVGGVGRGEENLAAYIECFATIDLICSRENFGSVDISSHVLYILRGT